jgi:mitogen-activated protein kinase kinase
MAQELLQPLANVSLNTPPAPTSRSTTPKPKLASLKTSGDGVAASIGAPDPEIFDSADADVDVPAPPPLRPSGLSLSLGMPRRPSQTENTSENPRQSLRPPPIGGGAKKRGPLLAIPMGTVPMGAIGADEPDALDLIGPTDDLSSTAQSNGGQPPTPLNLGGDEGELTVRPALPQGHSQAKSIDKIKAAISPAPSTGSPADAVAEDDWAEADEFLVDVHRLGEGAGGEVWKVEDTRTGIKLARKIIQARTTPPKQLVRELKYLKDTGHVNIVRFYGAYISPSSSEVKVLMEFCEGGSLEAIGEKIKQGKGRVSEPVAAKIGEGVSVLPFTDDLPSSFISIVTIILCRPPIHLIHFFSILIGRSADLQWT